jgi:hypothetical protein
MATLGLMPTDLEPFGLMDSIKAQVMIDDALAMARMVAPCLGADALTADQAAAAKAVVRGAVLRWHEAGDAGLTQRQQTIGPASIGESFDNRQNRRGMFWPTEIHQLQAICRTVSGTASPRRAFEIDTVPPSVGNGYWTPSP